MITIYINDEPMHIEQHCSVLEFMAKYPGEASHSAVAVNNQFIPRTTFPSTLLNDGDRIDLIVPMQGG